MGIEVERYDSAILCSNNRINIPFVGRENYRIILLCVDFVLANIISKDRYQRIDNAVLLLLLDDLT